VLLRDATYALPPLRIGRSGPIPVHRFAGPSDCLFVFRKQPLYLIHFALLTGLDGHAQRIDPEQWREDANGPGDTLKAGPSGELYGGPS
jgi:hypothetical protein